MNDSFMFYKGSLFIRNRVKKGKGRIKGNWEEVKEDRVMEHTHCFSHTLAMARVWREECERGATHTQVEVLGLHYLLASGSWGSYFFGLFSFWLP